MRLSVLLAGSSFPRLRSAVTLLASDGRHVLVDSGWSGDGDRLLAALAGEGLEPADVDVVVSTHLHYDHCGNHLLFPSARYLLSAGDLEDCRTFMRCFHADATPGKRATAELLRASNEAVKPFHVRSIVREVSRNLDFYDLVLEDGVRFEAVEDGCWLTDEVELIPTVGHTRGHLSVVAHGVELAAAGGPVEVLVAGDALFDHREVSPGGQDDLPLVADLAAYRRTRAALLARFRWVIPGHGDLLDVAALGEGAA